MVNMQVEEFLEGLLNDPDVQLGLPEDAKSANTIALSDKSDDVENNTVTYGYSKNPGGRSVYTQFGPHPSYCHRG